jgi:hypothetical protein
MLIGTIFRSGLTLVIGFITGFMSGSQSANVGRLISTTLHCSIPKRTGCVLLSL